VDRPNKEVFEGLARRVFLKVRDSYMNWARLGGLPSRPPLQICIQRMSDMSNKEVPNIFWTAALRSSILDWLTDLLFQAIRHPLLPMDHQTFFRALR
jgi:hypothetical protein